MAERLAASASGPFGALSVEPHASVRRRQRVYWEELSGRMSDLFRAPTTQYYRRREIALIRRHLGPLQGKRVLKLDLWNEAFNTRILHWMCDEGARATGVDISSVTTRIAKRNGRAETRVPPAVVRSDIRELPYASDSFDCVYTMGTIEHIDEYEVAVREIQRVLKVGGRAIVGVPHKWNIFLRPLLVTLLDAVGKYPYSPEKAFSARELRQLAQRNGLRVLHRSGILLIPGIVRMGDLFLLRRGIRLHRLLVAVLVRPFELLETHFEWAKRLGYLIAVVVEKPPSADPPTPSRAR